MSDDYEIQKRKFRQQAQRATDRQFWDVMNNLHGQAYNKAVQHYAEAAEIVLTPKLRQQLHDKANEIRELWDGMQEIEIQFTEFTLHDILADVQKEMIRAAGIHGPKFTNWQHAKESIAEEWQEVIEAVEAGDSRHAYVEAVQLIGVIVKLIRQMSEMAQREVNHLREALEFYADEDNWRGGLSMASRINVDGGECARKALNTSVTEPSVDRVREERMCINGCDEPALNDNTAFCYRCYVAYRSY